MSCPQTAPAPLRCPTFEESFAATAKLAPRGRVWPVNDGGGTVARFLNWLTSLNGRVPALSEWSVEYGQAGWFAAVSSVRNYIEQRLCALRLEFWCATQSETNDLWMREYGLPDTCDPFPDLCMKVAAIGGTRCEYYAALAARGGWSITCATRADQCGSSAGCAKAGRLKPGVRSGPGVFTITVSLANSPAYGGFTRTRPKSGKLKAGRPLSCGPDIGPLVCLIDRVVHAEVQTVYEVA